MTDLTIPVLLLYIRLPADMAGLHHSLALRKVGSAASIARSTAARTAPRGSLLLAAAAGLGGRPSNVWSVTVRSGSSMSYREIIWRGTVRGRMALASASLS
jgi:hypothetical protein